MTDVRELPHITTQMVLINPVQQVTAMEQNKDEDMAASDQVLTSSGHVLFGEDDCISPG